MFKKLFAALAILISAFSLTGCAPDSSPAPEVVTTPKTGIFIESAWISATDDSGASYVYANITNRLNGTITLVGGSTDSGAEAIVTKNIDGKEVLVTDGVDIHVGETLELSENKKHLTITKLSKPITPGDKVLFTFKLNGTDSQTVSLTAK